MNFELIAVGAHHRQPRRGRGGVAVIDTNCDL